MPITMEPPFVSSRQNTLKGTVSVITADDVLHARLSPQVAMQWETDFGDAGLMRAMKVLDMVGPFRAVIPSELVDELGMRRINATCTGYSSGSAFVRTATARKFKKACIVVSARPRRTLTKGSST